MVTAQKDNALRVADTLEIQCPFDLILILVQIIDLGVFAESRQAKFDFLQKLEKEHVARAFDEYGDRRPCLSLEISRVAVRLVALLLDDREDLLAGSVAHVGMPVEHARNRPHPVARQARDISDVHLGYPFYPLTAPAATPLMMCFWAAR